MNVANVKQVDRTVKQSFEIITPYRSLGKRLYLNSFCLYYYSKAWVIHFCIADREFDFLEDTVKLRSYFSILCHLLTSV